MERIIDNIRYIGQKIPDCWELRTWEVNGHTEKTIRPVIGWVEDGQHLPDNYNPDGYLNAFGQLEPWSGLTEQDIEDARLKSLKRSASRAKIMCRRVIKSEGFNELLTLTYKDNMLDRDTCKKHFKEWVRRMKRALGAFRYCASFERQERGAMHVHIATNKLAEHGHYKGVKVKTYQLGTRIWRDIVKTGGLCFVGGKTKNGKTRRNLSNGKMAAYVSKYILKDFEDAPEESNRYSRSNGINVPKSTVIRFVDMSMSDVISLAFECRDGDVIVSHWLGKYGDCWGLDTEPDRRIVTRDGRSSIL
jgi:hypothetical protein